MKSSAIFFVIQDVIEGDNGKLSLRGQFIINGKAEIVSPAGSQLESDQPEDKEPRFAIQFPRMFEVKWILPPQSGSFYDAVKAFAEAAGYDTVEHDDFRYPAW
jgi:hypothetical protein